jgi:SWI/SNF-related matrix-associated actin-dependent regulator 1 of chromatin subfamily A
MASSGGSDWISRLEQGSGPVASPQVSAVDADTVRDLYDYQKDAVRKALERDGRILLAHDMGLGKTVTGLTIMNHYRGDWPLLILCPKAVLTQWAEEVARWSGRPTTAVVKGKVTRQGKSVIDVKGSVVRGDMKVKKFDGEVKVVITTFDVLKGNLDALRFRPGGGAWRAVILDESHKCKSPETKRTQAVLPVALGAARCVLLTGTPMCSGANDLWSQIQMALQPRARSALIPFGRFQRRYCEHSTIHTPCGSIDRWSGVKKEHEEELNRVLATVMDRAKKEDVASQLPSKTVAPVYFTASPAVRKKLNERQARFKAMQKADEIAELEGTDERVPTHEVLKLFVECAVDRAAASAEWVKEFFVEREGDDKCIVFAYHRAVLDALETQLKKCTMIRIDGSTSSREREALLDRFKTDDKCRIALLSLGTCSTGLNLQHARTILFAEMYWSQTLHAQAEDRIHRIGSEEPCNIFYAMFPNSLDGMVYASLRRKAETVRNVVDAAPPATPAKRKPVPKVTPDAKGVLTAAPAAPPNGPPPVTPKKKRRIIEESDEEDCEMGETLSAAERSRRAQAAAERAGDVQDVDGDDCPLECAPVKTAKEARAVVLHATCNPPTKAHFEMVKAVIAHLERSRHVEVKEVVLATTSDAYVSKKADGPYLCGEDRRTLIKLAAEEQGLGGLIQAADGSKASSGSGYIRKCYMGDYRALNVVGSDVAIKYPKHGECVVVMRGNDAQSAVRSARPDAIIVPALPGFLADLSSTKVRNALDNSDSDAVAKFCGSAVAKAMASMTRHAPASWTLTAAVRK